jgi:uncharacterized membrane protein YqhA
MADGIYKTSPFIANIKRIVIIPVVSGRVNLNVLFTGGIFQRVAEFISATRFLQSRAAAATSSGFPKA